MTSGTTWQHVYYLFVIKVVIRITLLFQGLLPPDPYGLNYQEEENVRGVLDRGLHSRSACLQDLQLDYCPAIAFIILDLHPVYVNCSFVYTSLL